MFLTWPRSGSFVDDHLRESQSDLLFSVSPKQALLEALTASSCPRYARILIYLLMEHKSQPDPMISVQMLKYVVRVLEQSLREDQPLACVIPLIVYHGEAAWTVARSLDDLLKVPDALKRHMPQFSPILLDLSHQPKEKKHDRLLNADNDGHNGIGALRFDHHRLSDNSVGTTIIRRITSRETSCRTPVAR